MFGLANALFAGLAFAGVIYAILLQRDELRRSAKAQEEMAEAQGKSEAALARQAELMEGQALALSETARLIALVTPVMLLPSHDADTLG